ncbi:MAG: hypothetical protein V2A73_14340 [Pseudomonadota bacterium]
MAVAKGVDEMRAQCGFILLASLSSYVTACARAVPVGEGDGPPIGIDADHQADSLPLDSLPNNYDSPWQPPDACPMSDAVSRPDAIPRSDGAVQLDGAVQPDGAPEFDAAAECVLVPQSGCTQGDACDLATGGGSACRDVAVSGDEMDTCVQKTECATGNSCLSFAVMGSLCTRLCVDSTQCTGPGGQCAVSIADRTDVKACTANCSPISAAGCPEGAACRVYRFDGLPGSPGGTMCEPAGIGVHASKCSFNTDCAAGHVCVAFVLGNECRRYCQPFSCPTGTCQSPDRFKVGTASYGYCG